MVAPYRLVQGSPAPRQQSSTSCGAACLTVARMLVDAPFARWVVSGTGHPVLGAEGSTEQQRFASWEATVRRRTNGWRRPGGGVDLPWPPQLGTPPWGVRHELEHGASRVGTRYETAVVRHLDAGALRALHARLLELVVDGEPAALYVGDRWLPRHVTLVMPSQHAGRLTVYDPGAGAVRSISAGAFSSRRLGLSGWQQPWLLVRPTGHRTVRSGGVARPERISLPRLTPDPTPEPLHRR